MFLGTWSKNVPSHGKDFLTLQTGVSFWVLENLEVRNYRVAVLSTGGRHSNVQIKNVDAFGVRSGMELSGGAPATEPMLGSHDWLIQDCEFVGYTKRGIRFQNGSYNVRVVNCVADAGGAGWATELFHEGFNVQGAQTASKQATDFAPDHDISFERCVAKNNYNNAGAGYWNSDVFAPNPHPITCITPIVAHWITRTAGLWTHGTVRAEQCKFHNNAIGVDLDTAEANVTLIDCILSLDDAAKKGTLSTVEAGGKLSLVRTALWQKGVFPGGDLGDDPQSASVPSTWDGTGPNLNSGR